MANKTDYQTTVVSSGEMVKMSLCDQSNTKPPAKFPVSLS